MVVKEVWEVFLALHPSQRLHVSGVNAQRSPAGKKALLSPV